jgi:hypothetical protein
VTVTVKQLAENTSTTTTVDNMIPIFIGISKTQVSSIPVFTDSTYNIIQLNPDSDQIIDSTSIVPTISYWKDLTSEINLTNSSSTNTVICSIAITSKFNSNSLFVIYDSSNNLLFASNISSFTYNLNSLISFNLSTILTLTGTLKYKLIEKVSEIIPYTYDVSSKQVTLTFTNRSNIITFPTVIKVDSTIVYNYTNNTAILTVYDTISSTDISNEKNLELSKGLNYSKQAIVVSIPNETYINDAINLIKYQTVGYYIVPISLSDSSIKLLSSYVKSITDNRFLSLLIPGVMPADLILDAGYYIEPDRYVQNGYVIDGYSVTVPVPPNFPIPGYEDI